MNELDALTFRRSCDIIIIILNEIWIKTTIKKIHREQSEGGGSFILLGNDICLNLMEISSLD